MGKTSKHLSKTIIKTMDLILLIVGVLTVAFTVVMIILFSTHSSVPDTLITCWFAAVGGECGIMGWIKTEKVRALERQWKKEDEAEENKHD